MKVDELRENVPERILLLAEIERILPSANKAFNNILKKNALKREYQEEKLVQSHKDYEPPGIMFFLIIPITLILSFFAFTKALLSFQGFSGFVFGLIAAVLTGFIITQILKYVLWKIHTVITLGKNKTIQLHNEKVKRRISPELEELERENTQLFLDINSTGIFPTDYMSPENLATFQSYLSNRRADTLKECINLYEEEKARGKILSQHEEVARLQAAQKRRMDDISSTLDQIHKFK